LQFNLYHFVDQTQSECLNAELTTPFVSVLQGRPNSVLSSDTDEQLLIKIGFREKVRLHSLGISGPDDGHAPARIKLFIDKQSMSFSDAESVQPRQELVLSSTGPAEVPLEFVKFQNVSHLSV
jgi:hypothetical protein